MPVLEGFKGRSITLPMACLERTVLAVQTVAVQCVLHGQLRMLLPAACRAVPTLEDVQAICSPFAGTMLKGLTYSDRQCSVCCMRG